MAAFTLTIAVDNDAFQPEPDSHVAEILRAVADRLEDGLIGPRIVLHDGNGNRVGTAGFEEGD